MAENQLTVRTSAPGKVILSGEHSVVYGKLALAASLGLRTKFELVEHPGPPDVITIELASLDFVHVYTLKDIQQLLDKSPPILKPNNQSDFNISLPELIDHDAFAKSITSHVNDFHVTMTSKQTSALTSFFYLLVGILGSFDLQLVPFTLKVATDLTLSSGTGSSASYVVAIATGLLQYVRTKKLTIKADLKEFQLRDSSDNLDQSELAMISKWGYAAEKIIHGSPSGIDNTICTYGSMVEFRRGIDPKLVKLSTTFRFLLIDTNVPKDTKIQVNKVASLHRKHPKIVDDILRVIEETTIDVLSRILRIDSSNCQNDEYVKLGELFEINHNLLRCLGVSHVRLDQVCQVLNEFDLKGKLTGAGGGGYAICLVAPSITSEVLEGAIVALKGQGFDVIVTELGGEGATID